MNKLQTEGFFHYLLRIMFQNVVLMLHKIYTLVRAPHGVAQYQDKYHKSIHKILIVKTHAIGDVILVTPSIRTIKEHFPDAKLWALVGNWSQMALAGNRHLEGIITFEDDILFRLRVFDILRLVKRIRQHHFDCAFIFQPSIFVQFLVWCCGIERRIGFDSTGTGGILTDTINWDINDNTYIAETFLKLSRLVSAEPCDLHLEFAISEEDHAFAKSFLASHSVREGEACRLIGVCPGGGVNPRDRVFAKLWHTDRYVALIRYLIRECDYSIILFGSKGDQLYIDRIVRNLGSLAKRVINAGSQTTLKQMAALFLHCKLIITNDSAPVHIAVALDCPTVTIFGPTNNVSLLPANGKHIAVFSDVDCRPCYHNSPFPGCYHVRCMDELTVDRVIESFHQIMEMLNEEHHHSCV